MRISKKFLSYRVEGITPIEHAMHGAGRFAVYVTLAWSIPDSRQAFADGHAQYFDIPAQTVGAALLELAQQARVPVLFPSDAFTDMETKGLQGEYRLDIALQVLLEGTGVQASVVGESQQIVIHSESQESENQKGESMQNQKIKESRNLFMTALAAAFMGGATGTVSAQAPAASGGADSQIEEIAVTGSRIARDGMSTPVPVTVMDTEALSTLSPGQLIEAVDQLPQFFNNTRPDGAAAGRYSGGSAGQSFLNMRGMGANRTLVLLNGRRMVPSSKLGSNDINLFPQAMIQRMEVVTGGASAAYGTDAVSGVTNFIINTDYSGFDASIQTGQTSRNDRNNEKISLTYGTDLTSRLHIQASVQHFHSDSLFGYEDRHWFRDWAQIPNPDPNGPALITVPDVRTRTYTSGGLITGGPLAGTQFLADGTPAPFAPGHIVTPSSQAGGDGMNPQRENELYPETMSQNAFLYMDYDLNANAKVFLQGIIARGQVDYIVSELAQFRPFGEATIFADNAYLPDSLRAQMLAENIESFPMGRRSSLGDWQDVEGTRNRTESITAGVEYHFANEWRLNAYYQHGTNDRVNNSYTARIDRAYRAMDAVFDPVTNEIVCRSTLSNPGDGCVPANFFGIGQMSEESKDYILGWRVGNTRVKQHMAEVAVDGELFQGFEAGPILAAFGASYRRDTLVSNFTDEPDSLGYIPPDDEVGYKGLPSNYDNNPDIYFANEMLAASGGYNVKEVFAEFNVPLLADHPWAEDLGASLSARYADYSGSGGVLAWKGGIDWQLTSDVRLRFTRSRDTRAANLGERYDWQRTSGGIDDPFIGTLGEPPLEGVIQGGNPNVDPELSDTITFGIVYQPSWLDGLSLSVDKYSVDIEDAIAQVGAQNIVNQCFNEGAFCEFLKQDPATGEILRVDNVQTNLEQATVEGVDVEIGYTLNLAGDNRLNLRLLGSYLSENSFTNQFGSKIERAGEGNFPNKSATAIVAYSRGALSASLSLRYIGSATLDYDDIEGVHVDHNSIASATYSNLRLSYDFDGIYGGSLQTFLNVENLTDRDPPLAASTFSSWTGAGHTNSLFDQLGRRYTVGMRYSF